MVGDRNIPVPMKLRCLTPICNRCRRTHIPARSSLVRSITSGARILSAKADPWSWADQRLEEIYSVWSDERERTGFLAELDVLRGFGKTAQPRGTGDVLDTIWNTRKALAEGSFEDVARTAILFGHDTIRRRRSRAD